MVQGPDNSFCFLQKHDFEVAPLFLGRDVPNHYVVHTTGEGTKTVIDYYQKQGCLIVAAHIHCVHSFVGPVGSMGWFMRSVHRIHDRAQLTIVDTLTEPQQLIELAIKNKINVLIPTDHDTQRGIAVYENLAGNLVKIIPGLELTTSFGHLLIIGYHFAESQIAVWGELMRDPRLTHEQFLFICDDIIAAAAPGRIRLIPAHPNDPKDFWRGPELHGFEIHNARSRWNPEANNGPRKQRLHQYGNFHISGLDAHDEDLLRAIMVFPDIEFEVDDPWERMINPGARVLHVLQPVEPLAGKVPDMIRMQAIANELPTGRYLRRIAFPIVIELLPTRKRLAQAAGLALAAKLAMNFILRTNGRSLRDV